MTARLLWFCLRHDLEFWEDRLGISLDKQPGETALLFRTDSEEFRHHFYGPQMPNPPAGERIASDVLFFYKNADHPPLLSFVELKRGREFRHALHQLERVLGVVVPGIERTVGPTQHVALVVSDRATTRVRQDMLREFVARTGVRFRVRTVPLDTAADLRVELQAVFGRLVAERPPGLPQ
jgi:hypothetical protein